MAWSSSAFDPMTTPHTPGPWHNGWGKVTDSEGKAICMVIHRKNGDNGNLIASAPELLSALERLLYSAESLRDDLNLHAEPESFSIARAIISKAKGIQ